MPQVGGRIAFHPIEPLFLERWSPRAFDRSDISDDDLKTMFEAARWAPSSFNYQPWRFVYAHRGTAEFARILATLLPFNAAWAQHASVLVLVLSDTLMEVAGSAPGPSHSHSFDAGAAWGYLALQARSMGYDAHGMTGVDFAAARDAVAAPERFRIEAAIAIGRRADPAVLPEKLRAREFPSDRMPLSQMLFEGTMPGASQA